MKKRDCIKELKIINEKSFEEIFREHFVALHQYAIFYTGNSQVAEDLVHDVFFKIWETRKTLEIHTSIKSYLYCSVNSKCISYLRHLKVVNEHSKKQAARLDEAVLMNRLYFETGIDKLYENEIASIVEEAICRLPEKTGAIFRFSRNQYQKNREIAKKLNISEKAVEYHITRALIILREELKDYLPVAMIFICSQL